MSEKSKLLSDVVSLTEHYSKERDTIIYIFGDKHGVKPSEECKGAKSIPDLMEEIVKENKEDLIDIFLEISHLTSEQIAQNPDLKVKDSGLALDSVLQRFAAYRYGKSKDPQHTHNIRLHSADPRDYRDKESNIFRLYTAIEAVYRLTMIDMPKDALIEQYDEALSALKLVFKPEEVKTKLSTEEVSPALIMLGSKVPKQLAAIPDRNTLGVINMVLQQKIDAYNLTYGDITKAYKILLRNGILVEEDKFDDAEIGRQLDRGELQFLSDILGVTGKVRMILAHMMDYYLLGRLFRSYRSGPSVRKAIIYVGDFHAENYRQVLSLLGFALVQEAFAANASRKEGSKQKGMSCLDISAFGPFFSL